MWQGTVRDIIILADMEEGSVYKPKSKQILILPLQQFRKYIVMKALM
jgi:hypothetical protein